MKEKLKNIVIPTPVYFVIAILIIMYFTPLEGKYRYAYTENKPWQYSLLTAPFNFHIDKPQEVVQAEQDSIKQSFQPYFMANDAVIQQTINLFTEDAKAKSIPNEYVSYVKFKINELYKAGIISVEDHDKVENDPKKTTEVEK